MTEIDTKQSDFKSQDYKTFDETFETEGEKAYADYILLDSQGHPLAVVEAKKSSKDPITGQKQAEDYADDIKKQTGSEVFIFLTNGYEIWFWNRGYEGVRPVKGFYSQDDLEKKRFQNISKKSFDEVPINQEIIDRPYQYEAVKRVLEGIDRGKRKFLIVQATGTGKTRVSMALVDTLLRSNRAKRVLFLADRKELRDQAYDENFKVFFPNDSKTRVYSDTVDKTHRIYVSTIQTFENVFRSFSVGFFDLIISDEAHRSIYNKWKDVFTYFDALHVGLTATPSDMIDKDTFRFFDCHDGNPTFLYTYAQAIDDDNLCDYAVYDARTHFQIAGITRRDVPESERLRLAEEGIDPDDIDFTGTDIEKKVAVIGTNEALVKEFMDNCIMDQSGTLPAKTIIFPVSIKHAKRIWEAFEKLYPEYKGKLARMITSEDSRAKKIIKDFKKEDFPRIAISVGMLDTGVDIPEVCNLVFAKPIFSKIRFWQMIGRGTRHNKVCPKKEWLPNGAKEDFVIFDFWKNFDYFQMHPRGKEASVSQAVTSRIFLTRLQQYDEFLDKSPNYVEFVKEKITEDIKSLPKDSVSIKERMRDIEIAESARLWSSVGIEPIPFLKTKIASLMKHKVDVNLNESMFTLKCEQFVLAMIRNNAAEMERAKETIAEYVLSLPTTLNAVKEKIKLIDTVISQEFWEHVQISDIWRIRDELTPLMQYKRSEPSPPIVIDMSDTIQERRIIQYGPLSQEEYVDTYQAKVERKIKDLAKSTPAIQKIQKNQVLTDADLEELEKTLNRPELYITEENLKKIYQKSGTMIDFVKKILGLYEFPDYKKRIHEAFQTFTVEKHYLSANQVNFVRTLETVFISKQHIEYGDFFESPFTNIANSPLNVFKTEELEEMIELCKKLEVEVLQKR